MSTPFTSPPSNTAATVSGMVVAVGSTNPAKVKAVEAVVARSFPDARVRPVAVASGVSEQPLSADETERGARTRALSALAAVPEARFGIGLEGGVHFRRGGRSRRAVPGRGRPGDAPRPTTSPGPPTRRRATWSTAARWPPLTGPFTRPGACGFPCRPPSAAGCETAKSWAPSWTSSAACPTAPRCWGPSVS